MDSWQQEAKALFGRAGRVALAAWILDREGEPFFLLEAQDAMRRHGEAGSAVRTELGKFVDHGMLNELPDGRRVYFVVQGSPYWLAFDAITVALGLRPAGAPVVKALDRPRRSR